MAGQGVSGVAVGVLAAGSVLVWTGLRGGSVAMTLQEIIQGKRPSGQNAHPIEITSTAEGTAGIQGAAIGAGSSAIVAIAATGKGQCYGFGAGHTSNPCASRCTDCSSYVSCVLNKAGVLKGSLATGGLSRWGVGVPYAQRQPGDVIVWNGGTGGGHTGIIIDGSHMWHNPCTRCGGVQIGRYPYGNRSAASAVVRRAK